MKPINDARAFDNEQTPVKAKSTELAFLFPDRDWLIQLDRLLLKSSSPMKGLLAGKRRSSQLGSSLDFADYRSYVPGDDVRRLDWNVYGRTQKAVIRQFWDEQERAVHIYIDASLSMTAPIWEQHNKYQFAVQLAASVGYIALQGDDRVIVKQFNEQGIVDSIQPLYGKGAAQRLFAQLSNVLKEKLSLAEREKQQIYGSEPSASQLNLLHPFKHSTALPWKAGMTWLITDGLYETGFEQLLAELRARGQEIVVVLVLHQEELEPSLTGELQLIDIELKSSKHVAMSNHILTRYQKELQHLLSRYKESCGRYDVPLYIFNASEVLSEQFMKQFITRQQLRFK